MYLHKEGFSDIRALNNAVMFCFLKMQLKLEIALLVSFDQKRELVYTPLGGADVGEKISI